MLKLAVIGAGQLGSRHLQALALLGRAAEITVLDPSASSLSTARNRFEQVASRPSSIKVRFSASFEDLPTAIDAAVVATPADARLAALERLLARSRVHCLLLEKVLFQRLADYDAASALFDRGGVRAWVNCSQRLWPFFSDLRPRTLGRSNLQVTVTGAQWGLGCNAIHNLDLLPFLTGSAACRIEAGLDSGTVPSKRPGFIEFTGTLYAFGEHGNRVVQTSYREGNAPFQFEAQGQDFHALWRVGNGTMRIAEAAHDWTWSERPCAAPFQSQLTHAVLLEMIDHGRSVLPTYAESATLHVAMLRALLEHQNGRPAAPGDVCAIT